MRCNLAVWVLLLMSAGAHGLETTGRLVWGRHAVLSTPVSGMVVEVMADVGDRVKAGEPLVRLEQRAITARVKSAEKQVERRRQAFAEAERELDRTRELYDRTLLSDHDLQVVQIAHTASEAELREAESELERSRLRLQYSVVRAPFAGIVVERMIHPGMAVVNTHVSIPLIAVAALEPYRVVARVPVNWAAAVSPGAEAKVEIGGDSYPGRVVSMLPDGFDKDIPEAGYQLRVVFDGPVAEGLNPGQTARVVVP